MVGSAPAVILMAGRTSASGGIKEQEHISSVLHVSALEFPGEDEVLRTYTSKAGHWKKSRGYDVLTEFFVQ